MLSEALLEKSQLHQSGVLRRDLTTPQDDPAFSASPPEPLFRGRGSGYEDAWIRPLDLCNLDLVIHGSSIISVTYRVACLQGVRIGADVYLDTLDLCDWDLITIGSSVAINEGASLIGHYFKDGQLHFGEVRSA